MARLLLLIIVLSSVAGKANGADKPAAGALQDYLKKLRYEPIAFTYDQNHPIVEGRLGDRKCSFMLDTGWTMTSLDVAAAAGFKTLAELGMASDDPFARQFPDDSIVVIEKLKLGRAEFMNQPAERRKLEADLTIRTHYRGILGFDFLMRNFCLIDCLRYRLYVRGEKPSDEVSKALANSLQSSGYIGVPLKGNGYFTVEALVNGKSADLVVDTGSFSSMLDQSEQKRLSLRLANESVTGTLIPQDVGKQDNAMVRGEGKIGSHRMRVVKLERLEIGGVDWRNLTCAMVDLKAWGLMDSKGNKRFSGTLGPDTMAPQGGLIDFSSRMLWFRPGTREALKR